MPQLKWTSRFDRSVLPIVCNQHCQLWKVMISAFRFCQFVQPEKLRFAGPRQRE